MHAQQRRRPPAMNALPQAPGVLNTTLALARVAPAWGALALFVSWAGCSGAPQGPDGRSAGPGSTQTTDGGPGWDAAANQGGLPPPTDDAGMPAECFGGQPEADLPARVAFRSKTQSFNRRWFVALHQGHIWVKPNTDQGQPAGDWRMLGTGLPDGAGISRFPPPTQITELSADGTWLHALSPAGVFYRGTDFTGDVHSNFTWSDSWGHPAALGPGMTADWPTTFGWSVSDAQGAGVHHYEDRLGTSHSVGLGVAHIYRLGPDGQTLFFNDWWLPADWSRQICMPDRGTFVAENLSVSASTVFLVGTQGELYTRLYDFDTAGENDTLEYSYRITAASGNTRALPAEDWRRQPGITEGLITKRITIFQDGQGNAARVLRVEGVRNGTTGFFHKHIHDGAWLFEETGHRVCGPFLNAPGRASRGTPTPDNHGLRGTLAVDRVLGDDVSVDVQVMDFNITCSPARVHILINGAPVTVGGQPLDFPFHHVHALVLHQRPTAYWRMGIHATIRAALILPADVTRIDDGAARRTLQGLFEDRQVINFKGEALPDRLVLTEMTWLDPLVGVVPGQEKADPGNAMQLQASNPGSP